jgi:hypothetical protein
MIRLHRILTAFICIFILSAPLVLAQLAQIDCSTTNCIYLPAIHKDPTTIPTNTPTITPTNQPLPTPAPTNVPPVGLVVKSATGAYRSHNYSVHGELYNGHSLPVYRVKITAKFYDVDNKLLASADRAPYLVRISPDQLDPFAVILSDAPMGIVWYELLLTTSDVGIFDYRDLNVISSYVHDNNGPEIRGEIRNDHREPITDNRVAVTFYDSTGTVVYTGSIHASKSTLIPGATATYTISTNEPNLIYTRYSVQAQGFVARNTLQFGH